VRFIGTALKVSRLSRWPPILRSVRKPVAESGDNLSGAGFGDFNGENEKILN